MLEDGSSADRTKTFTPLASGTEVGHYRIVDKIGAGGMGEVYLAVDSKLNRKVALKFLPPHLCQDDDCRKRFTREAQAAAGLDHPNIAAIHEVGEYQGRPYFAMQVVEGQSLREVIAGKDLPIDRVLEIAIQVCEGLQAAHDKGIIHRDIKPSNILLDIHGRVRIVDFGLASVRGSEQLTKTGSTLGTVGYMSPEQVRGQEVDHRSDLFSLGVVIYELLTKQNPFKRDSEAATLKAVSDDLPHPAARYRVDLPDSLQPILDKALDKDIKTRYQHADDLKADLMRVRRSFASGESTAVRPSVPRRRRVVGWLIAAVIVVAAVLTLIVTRPWSPHSIADKPEKIMLAVLPFENLGDPDDEYFADGITDEIISKLTSVRDLGVISRTSCMTYKSTTKPLPQIARELGVSYVLEGTIRWEKEGAEGRVRVTPQLVDVANDSHVWSSSYDRELSGIFAIQTEIAENVSQSLNVILSPSERPRLTSSGTKNPSAYLALLRGLALGYGNPSRENCEAAILEFQNTVRLDSGFARAWAELSMEYSYKYWSWERNTDLAARAEAAARKSRALDSGLPAGRAAAGYYYYWCMGDYEKALGEFGEAERLSPHDPRWIQATAWIWRRQGRFNDARIRLTRALELNPRDALLLAELAATCSVVRDYDAAAHYAELSLAVDPGMSWAYCFLIMPQWSGGHLTEAKHYLEEMGFNAGNLDVWFVQFLYERDYQSGVDSLLKSGIEEYDFGDFYYPTSLLVAELLELDGKADSALAYFDSARAILLEKTRQFPDDPRFYSSLGLALAGLGQRDEAVGLGLQAVKLCPLAHDAFRGPAFLGELAYIYLSTGDYDSALTQFERLLAIPSQFNAHILQLDPRLDPVRDDPRYKAMIRRYGESDAI